MVVIGAEYVDALLDAKTKTVRSMVLHTGTFLRAYIRPKRASLLGLSFENSV